MTEVEMEHYLKQVARRGKALCLPEKELEKWKDEFQRISLYLNREYKRFVISKIVRRKGYEDIGVFNAFVEEEKDGLIAGASEMLKQGDAENFDWFCWLLHLKYMTMWREKHGTSGSEKRQRQTTAELSAAGDSGAIGTGQGVRGW